MKKEKYMSQDKILERECEILTQVQKDELGDFIEHNWQRMRDILTDHDELSNREIMEALKLWYSEYT